MMVSGLQSRRIA